MWLFCFFFFKQKTAYEMRISDWSSDVCSSDLPCEVVTVTYCGSAALMVPTGWPSELFTAVPAVNSAWSRACASACAFAAAASRSALVVDATSPFRSEEHTSELQSLMRISYAVFCLKKKKTKHMYSYILLLLHTLS